MKLIIDIPKEIHEKIQGGEFWLSCGLDYSNAFDYIKNGIPLEQVRTEISAILTNSYDEGVKEKALQIIDKI